MKLSLPEFARARVMIVGDIMLDRYWYGQISRISPEAPVPVVKVNKVEERPGGAANVAMNIASLGANSHLIGITGIDNAAQILSKILSKVNVTCDFISLPSYSTIIKLRVISRNQQIIRLDFEETFENINLELLYERIHESINNASVLVISDYKKGVLNNVQKIINLARKSNIPILIDPKGNDFECYRGATLLTPNISEFESAVGKCKNEEEIVVRGMQLITDYDLSALLVTRAEQGMTLLQPNKTPMHIPTRVQEVYDVIGAGDTVISVIAATLAAGKTLEEACYFSNIAASIVVSKLGTSTVSSTEIENAVFGCSDIGFGIMNEKNLKIAITAARKRGEKVVMTNGVFDILHAGHIAYLANARKLADRLIVAINSDSSTKRLKGKMRPINTLKQRMIVLSALKTVDWVVSFEEDTPERLIADIMPDLLVKGGDYNVEQIAGRKEVLDYGGKVIILNFKDGFSSSNIIKNIQEKSTNLII